VSVSLYAKANCGGGVRAIRFKVDGNIIYELGAPEATATWNTGGSSAGSHTLTVEAAEQGDNNWSNPASSSMSYQLNGSPPPPPNPTCSITSFSASPSSPQQVGTSITLSGSASCDTGVRAIRFKVDGGIIYEIGAPSGSTTWNTSGASASTHTLTLEAAGQGDNSWSYAGSQSMTYVLQQSQPNPPVCQIQALSASPSSPQPPGTSVSIYGKASCDTGVRAIRFKVDGGIIYELGAPEATTTWNSPTSPGSHTLTVEAAGQGDNSWSYAASQSITYTLGSSTITTVDQLGLKTGDVVQGLGPDIFVIHNGQRRLVPNPETLDALGISRDKIKSLTDQQLTSIPRGPDVPDVNRDPSGFAAFKDEVFPDTLPITHNEGSIRPNSCSSTNLDFAVGAVVGLRAGTRVYVQASFDSQLVVEVRGTPVAAQAVEKMPIGEYTWWRVNQAAVCNSGFDSGWVAIYTGNEGGPSPNPIDIEPSRLVLQSVLVSENPYRTETVMLPPLTGDYEWVSKQWYQTIRTEWSDEISELSGDLSVWGQVQDYGKDKVKELVCKVLNDTQFSDPVQWAVLRAMCLKERLPDAVETFIDPFWDALRFELPAQKRAELRQIKGLKSGLDAVASDPSNWYGGSYLRVPKRYVDTGSPVPDIGDWIVQLFVFLVKAIPDAILKLIPGI